MGQCSGASPPCNPWAISGHGERRKKRAWCSPSGFMRTRRRLPPLRHLGLLEAPIVPAAQEPRQRRPPPGAHPQGRRRPHTPHYSGHPPGPHPPRSRARSRTLAPKGAAGGQTLTPRAPGLGRRRCSPNQGPSSGLASPPSCQNTPSQGGYLPSFS